MKNLQLNITDPTNNLDSALLDTQSVSKVYTVNDQKDQKEPKDLMDQIGVINEHSKHIKNVDEFNRGWNKENISVVNYWMNYLSYCCLIYHFYLFKLKKKENYWAWLIIVLSALASSLSLFQYNQDDYYIDIFLEFFCLFISRRCQR